MLGSDALVTENSATKCQNLPDISSLHLDKTPSHDDDLDHVLDHILEESPVDQAPEAPATDSPLQCLYTAPNWYQSHVLAASTRYLAYAARNMIQLLSHDLKPIRMLSSHPKRVTCVCFAGEETLVSGCDGGNVIAWDVEEGKQIGLLVQTPIPVNALSYIGGVLLSGDDKGIICFWGDFVKKSGSVARYQPFSEKILTMGCSDHEEALYVAVGYKLGTIAVMKRGGDDLTLQHTLKGHDSDIFRISWSLRSFPSTYPSTLQNLTTHNLLVTTSRDKTVKIWDAVDNRLIRSSQFPPKLSNLRESALNKEQPWAAVCWTGTGIVGSSATGDLACLEELETEDGICEMKWRSFDSPHAHTKKVFALVDLGGGRLVSTSMDRETILWETHTGECVTVAHGLGGFAYGLDISPLSPNRVAVGTGDNTVRVWEPYQNRVIQVWQGVRTKVMVIAWHPYREGLLSFGTEEGRVGIYDVNSGSMNTSSTYHEKAVYAMSWGYVPTKFEEDALKTGLYTCGGEGTIFCHKPKELGKPAVNVNSYIAAENKYKHVPPGRTAIDWEYTAKLLAVGCSNGLIEVFKAPNLQLLAVFQYHSRIINRLKWGRNEGEKLEISQPSEVIPEAPVHPQPQLLLGSCSDDNLVCVHDVTPFSTSPPSTTPILKADRALAGHTARITDIDWNPHNYRYIVSTSYDGTAQVWDIAEGGGFSNYRGHAGRVFSVRWSHTAIDCVFTGSDEFNVRQWRVTENEHSLPPKVNQLVPPSRGGGGRKKKRGGKKNVVISENKVTEVVTNSWRGSKPVDKPETVSENNPEFSLPANTQPVISEPVSVTVGVTDWKRKRGTKGKSLLPITSRRDHCNKSEQAEQILQIARDLFSDSSSPSPSLTPADVGLYSRRDTVFELVKEERDTHVTENHHHQAALLGVWGSDLTETIDQAIRTKTVTESLLSFSVTCGLDKYREAVRCYITQLRTSRDFVTAASYMLLLRETRQAIQMLVSEDCYREALVIAKMRLAPEDPLLLSIYEEWALKQEKEMQFDCACKCYLAAGDPRRAVLVMLRRKDVGSLENTVRVAEITGQVELLPAIRAALEEAREALVVGAREDLVERNGTAGGCPVIDGS